MDRYWQGVMQRRLSKRRFLIGAGALTAAGIAAACGGGSSDRAESTASGGAVSGGLQTPTGGRATGGAQPKRGGTLVVGAASNPRSQDPHTDPQGVHHWWYPLFDQLIGYNQKGELDAELSLAQRWEQVDPVTFRLSLRPGVAFHDGTTFDAESVKWNIARIQDPTKPSVARPDLAAIDRVETPSRDTVMLHLKQPNAALLTAFGDRGGMIISPAAFQKLGQDGFARAPVGTGPFTFKEWVVDAYAVYERYPQYWRKDAAGGALPYLQTIRINVIPEAAVLAASLESGEIDLLPFTPAAEVKRLDADKRFISAKFVGDKTSIYYMNHDFPPLDNLWFRRAVSAGLDRQTYIKNFLTGAEPLANGLLTPASWAYAPEIENYNYDPAKAKEYLQRSGLPADKWRFKAAAGTTVSDANLMFEASLKSAGITVEWVAGPDQFNSKLMKGFAGDGSLGMLLSTWGMRVDPDGSVSQFYTHKGTYNAGLAPVPETEELVVKARQTYDVSERKKLYTEIQKKGVENVYSAFLLDYTVISTHAAGEVGNMENLYLGEGKVRFANLWV